jgi:hypothetical protein
MPNAPTSKAVLAVPTVGDQWHQKRVSRKLDDRDQVLEEAIQLVEEYDTAVYPYIVKFSGWDAAAQSVTGTSSIVLVLTFAGTSITGATITATLGGESGSVAIGSGTQATITWAGGLAGFTAVPTAGDVLMLYVRVNDVLVPVPALAPCVA